MRNLFYAGYHIDVEGGVVYGRRGQPMTKLDSSGYIQVGHGRSKFYAKAHRMIWEAAHGPIPEGLQINHINGIKTDNRIENLEVVTPSENLKHAYRIHLTTAIGEKNGRAKLSPNQVLHIRSSGESQRNLALRYGVSRRTIRAVISRENWSHTA